MKTIKIQVVEGKLIRDPKTTNRLQPGRNYTVPAISYWLRRLDEGDVVKAMSAPKKSSKPKKKKLEPKTELKNEIEDKKEMGE